MASPLCRAVNIICSVYWLAVGQPGHDLGGMGKFAEWHTVPQEKPPIARGVRLAGYVASSLALDAN